MYICPSNPKAYGDQMNREELIMKLHEMAYGSISMAYIQDVANFIIEDRKRICEPLAYWKDNYKGTTEEISYPLFKSITETLQRAGLDKEGS